MSGVQQFLATLVANARKPGALKILAGQLAIAYGSNLVSESAADAAERAERSQELFEKIHAATGVAIDELNAARQMTEAEVRQQAITGIRGGHLDDEVRARAGILAARDVPDPADVAGLVDEAELVDERPADGPADVGMLAGDGSFGRPFRTVDTIASVLDDDERDGHVD